MAKKPEPDKQRALVTVDLGPQVLELVDLLVSKFQAGMVRRCNRSKIIRQCIILAGMHIGGYPLPKDQLPSDWRTGDALDALKSDRQ